MNNVYFIPEWASQQGVLLALPHEDTDWNYILEEAREQYFNIIKVLTDNKVQVFLLCKNVDETKSILSGCDFEYLKFIECEFNDTWTRDYGPISIYADNCLKALDLGFNGWGLKFAADKDNLVNLFLKSSGVINDDKYLNVRSFILEGGSIETDGKGNLLTTSRCLLSPNRNGSFDRSEIEDFLRKYLGCHNIIFLTEGELIGDDTDSHIDTLARFTPFGEIVFSSCQDCNDVSYPGLEEMKRQIKGMVDYKGSKFISHELPIPEPIFDESGYRLPATYTNFLYSGNKIFFPTYSQPENDKFAIETMETCCPGYKVIPVACDTLIKQHGSLHCATMQIPSGLFNF